MLVIIVFISSCRNYVPVSPFWRENEFLVDLKQKFCCLSSVLISRRYDKSFLGYSLKTPCRMSSFRNVMPYLHGKTTLNHMVELCLYRISRKSHHSLDDKVTYLQKIKEIHALLHRNS